MAEKKNVDEIIRVMFVVWGGILFSQFILAVFAYTTKPQLLYVDLSKPALGAEPIPIIVMGLIAVSILIASFFVRNSLIAAAISSRDTQKLQSAYIVGMAMSESISLIGVVAAIVFEYQYFVVFFLIAIVAIVLHRPKMTSILAATFEDKI
ncbi:MAG TPA: hypothetical protein PLR83_05780 [Pyrinomonadaceae bacterium]|nr:hypothetical protein [Pyrinomonadaceae bacterium]